MRKKMFTATPSEHKPHTAETLAKIGQSQRKRLDLPSQIFCEHSIKHVILEGPSRGGCEICSQGN